MKHIITLLALIFSLSLNAQYKLHATIGSSMPGQDFFATAVSQDWNGGYYSISEDIFNNDFFLTRHAPDGTVLFSRTYQKASSPLQMMTLVVSPADSSLYISSSVGGANGVYIMKLDSSGNVLFCKEHTQPVSGNYNAFDLFINADGSLTYFGGVYECPGTCVSYATVIRFNSSGDIIGNTKYTATNTNTNYVKASQLSNGNFLVCLESNNTVTSAQSKHIMVVNQSGAVMAQTAYQEGGTGVFFNPYAGLLHSNGNYYVAGNLIGTAPSPTVGDYGVLLELNSSLALQNVSSFQYLGNGAIVTTLFEDTNTDILGLGSVYTGPFGDQDGMLAVFDPSTLGIVSSRAYGTSNSNDMFKAYRAIDGGIFSLGSAYDNGVGSNLVEHIKLDSQGELGCNQTDITLSPAAFSVSLTSVPLSTQSGGLSNTLETITSSTYSPNQFILCSSLSCAINVTYTQTNVDCNGNSTGSITPSVTGVSGSETYSWTGPNGFTASTANISGLEAGVYNLTITDGTCTEMVVATITEPNALALSYTSANPSCTGDNDGSINMTITGGTSPFTQTWTGPNSYTSSLEDINGLLAGTYNVTVNDANGCTTTGQVTLIDPPALTVTVSTNNVNCNGGNDGTASAFATGGTPGTGYTFSWNNGQTNQTAINLVAGTYNVTVTDANGCTAMATGLVGEPLALSVTVNTTPSACNLDDGSADAVVTGGTSPFNYTWSSGGSGSTESGLAGGSYTLDVTDANGCAANQESFVIGDTTYGVELCVIMVDTSSSMNELVWEKPAPTGISGFNIYRDIVGTYTLIDFWPYDSLSQYVDSSAGINPNNTSYRYRISVVDSCGGESELSNYHETIHVQLNIGGGQANLIWDEYEGFTFGYYRIMKDSLGNNNWQVLDSVSSTNFTYTDQNPGLDTRYRVDVIIPSQCTSTRANHNTTRSNRTQPANGGSQNGVGELSAHIFEVYPNPSTGDINITHSANSDAELLVYTGDGRLLEIIPIIRIQGPIHLDYVPGMYVLSLRDENGVTSRRVVIK